jgi:cyanobactin cluster PatC/TenC/TruC protein
MEATRMVMAFNGQDGVLSISRPLPPMSEGITIEFWAIGGENLPKPSSLFEAHDANGSRVLNIHLPWVDGVIYWDAGFEGDFDRIDKAATPAEYKGAWRHWAFVKDINRGKMKVYLDGVLWNKGVGKRKAIPESVLANIGAYVDGGNQWSGRLAEFRIWDKPRTAGEIFADQCRPLTGRESGLVGYWPLGRIDADGTTPDLAGDRPGKVQGLTMVPDNAFTSVMSLPEEPERAEIDRPSVDEGKPLGMTPTPTPPAADQPPSQASGTKTMPEEKEVAPSPSAEGSTDDLADQGEPLAEPGPDAVPEFQAMEPLSPDHIMGWKSTTTGLEDYAMWRQTLKDEKLEGDPPFRRGRIWA